MVFVVYTVDLKMVFVVYTMAEDFGIFVVYTMEGDFRISWCTPGKLEGNSRQLYVRSAANWRDVAYKLVLFYRPVLSGHYLSTRTRDC